MTYKEAYNKIIDAYFKDEIQPMQSKFCFCGTLHGDGRWYSGDDYYSYEQYEKMEHALLGSMWGNDFYYDGGFIMAQTKEAEQHIFEGMCAALDVLKQIHIERGEKIDEEIPFTQRVKV